jgi:AcrR family transcriptional regulator
MTLTDAGRQLDEKRADERYRRLMAATRDAAVSGGYDAVSMRALAVTCRLSMTTIYQFCRSKDQLVAEALVGELEAFWTAQAERPSCAASVESRVLHVMHAWAGALATDEAVLRPLLRALYSVDAEVVPVRTLAGAGFVAMVDTAVGDTAVADRTLAITTLGRVVDSVNRAWLSRRHGTDWAVAELDAAVRAIFRPAR